MQQVETKRRILIALTESTPLDALWRTAVEMLNEPGTELVALLLADDRWQRAASLPFVREISLPSGRIQEFTRQRAEQLQRQAISRVRETLEQRASEARLVVNLEVLLETEIQRVEELTRGAENVLVAPAQLTVSPAARILERIRCRIVFVEPEHGRG